MGLDNSRLTLLEPLRTWKEQGLLYLLSSHDTSRRRVGETSECTVSPVKKESAPPSTQWIEPWSGLLASRSGPCSTMWTYYDLGLDLCGQPDTLRRELWSNIIESLNWPKGSIVFWPFSHVSGNEPALRTDLFWRGVSHFKPGCVLLFGNRAHKTLFPERKGGYGFFLDRGFRFLFLPGPGDMLPDNRKAKRIVWDFLTRTKV